MTLVGVSIVERYGPTGLELGDVGDIDAWLDLCRSLGAIATGHQWWIGDALVYGEDRFGEEFAQGEAELGLPSATSANYRYVAAHVPVSRRREDLTWSHHAEVARLDGNAQRKMLAAAVRENWTVRQLRDAVALEYPAAEQLELGGGGLGEAEHQDVQRKLEEIERRLDSPDGLDFDDAISDLRWLLQLAKRLTRGAR